jgi:hypothetical protein
MSQFQDLVKIFVTGAIREAIFLVPARAETRPETTHITVKERDDALLECRVTGNPAPQVSWLRKVNICHIPAENIEM